MKKSRSQLIICLVVATITSCEQSTVLTSEERERISEEVIATLRSYHQDIHDHGLEAEFNYLDSSKDFFWVPPGFEQPISYDSVAAILRKTAPLLDSIGVSFDTVSIVPLSRYLVSYSGRLTSVSRDTDGNRTKIKLVETGILIRRKDGWKLLSGQTSVPIQR